MTTPSRAKRPVAIASFEITISSPHPLAPEVKQILEAEHYHRIEKLGVIVWQRCNRILDHAKTSVTSKIDVNSDA